jgi:ADP-heptose:LPS heptosyltransferase
VKKEHILVIRFSSLGDVAMAVPVIYSLARQYPDVRITMLSRGYARPLFEDLAPNVGFMEADVKHEYRGIRGLNALYRRLTAKQFTAIADLHNVLRSEFLRLRFNMGRYRVEHINKHRRGRRRITSAQHKRLTQQPSSFQNYVEVFERLGYSINIQFTSIFPKGGGDLSQLPSSMVNGQWSMVNGQWSMVNLQSLNIGIAPFAAHKGKIYPMPLMREVISQLTSQHPQAHIYLFGRGEQEDIYFDEWSKQFPQCVNVSRHLTTLRQELILMSHLNVMLSMDSANMHLASLTGIPVVSIWGATHPYAGFMGWGQTTANALQVDLPCRPCSIFGQKPCMRGDYACLNNIKPESVVEKINTILENVKH